MFDKGQSKIIYSISTRQRLCMCAPPHGPRVGLFTVTCCSCCVMRWVFLFPPKSCCKRDNYTTSEDLIFLWLQRPRTLLLVTFSGSTRAPCHSILGRCGRIFHIGEERDNPALPTESVYLSGHVWSNQARRVLRHNYIIYPRTVGGIACPCSPMTSVCSGWLLSSRRRGFPPLVAQASNQHLLSGCVRLVQPPAVASRIPHKNVVGE